MKRTMKFLALAAALTVFAVPAWAQKQECTDENKAAWYQKFLDNRKGNEAQQKVAYDSAKLYLENCPADPNDAQAKYMKEKFVEPYEKIMNQAGTAKQFEAAITSKNYPEQIKIGKQILQTDPENAPVNIVMGVAGLYDANVLPDSAAAAKKAISLIEAGKPYAPIASKDQALGYLNWVVAKSMAKSDPNNAITYFIKAARYEGDPKKNPVLYNELAAAYGEGPVAKLTGDYQAFVGKPESTESKLVKANLNQAIDRQIDAFARAAALATAADKAAIMEVLTGLYKDRMTNTEGLNDLVAHVLEKPVPDLPTPITTLPAATTSTPATNGATNGSTNGSGTTPAASTAPKKPKSR
jgi:tetratricopeptide (TPR) repeat protein